jgi:hypothetical protein
MPQTSIVFYIVTWNRAGFGQSVLKKGFCNAQVMSDFRAPLAVALEAGGEELERERAAFQEKASTFWKRSASDTANAKARKESAQPTKFRQGAADWLSAANQMLIASVGVGVLHFSISPDMERSTPPETWPALTICIDQGSDGWAATSYLQHQLRCCCLVLPDPSHRVWNDCQLALKGCKLWSLTMVMAKIFSLDQGPWEEARWFQQSAEAAKVYMSTADGTSCSLFQEMLGRILADSGDKDRIAEEGIAEEIWQSVPDAFKSKMPKVSMTRWFSWVHSADAMLRNWHRRLLVYLFISLAEGWVQHESAADFLKVVSKSDPKPGEDPEAIPTARDLPELQELRRKCKNSLQMTTTMLMDAGLRQLVQGIVLVLSPCMAWHTKQLKELQSASAACRWYELEACGSSLDTLLEIAGLLSDTGFWQQVGMWSPGDAMPWGASGPDHPVVFSDDALAGQVCQLALALLRARVRTMLLHTRGLPLRLAGLLDVSASKSVLEWLQKLDQAWHTGVASAKGGLWKKMRARSPMQLMVVKQARAHVYIVCLPACMCGRWQGGGTLLQIMFLHGLGNRA